VKLFQPEKRKEEKETFTIHYFLRLQKEGATLKASLFYRRGAPWYVLQRGKKGKGVKAYEVVLEHRGEEADSTRPEK